VATHLDDEEQLEAIKRWWRQNGVQIVAAVVLVIGGWYGWQFWQDRQEQRAQEASLIYGELVGAVAQMDEEPDAESLDRITHYASTLKELDSDSQYARYSGLILARLAVLEGDLDAAAGELEAVLEKAGDDPLGHIARLRLARVEAARDNGDRALALLDVDNPGEFRALYAEARGDILAGRGDTAAARAAYELALQNLPASDRDARPVLELKLNQLKPDNNAESADKEA
jgi:predicted negative regulator of RcsB-dependent stress response